MLSIAIPDYYLVLALGSDLLIKRKIKVFDIEYILIKHIAIIFFKKKSTMFTLSRPSPATKKWLQASNHHIGRITRKNTKETWINNSSNDNIQDPKMTRKEEADEFERQWQLIVSFHSSDESESDSLSMVAFDDEASLFSSSSSSSSSSDTMKKKRKQNRSWKRRFVLVSNYLTLRRKDKVAPARNIIDPELYDITCS